MGKAEFDAIAAVGNLHNGALARAFGTPPRMSAEEQRDAAIAKEAARIADATRTLILTGHVKTLHDFANAVGDRLSQAGVCDQLVRAALASGPITTGQLFTDLLTKCIADDAEETAIKEIERQEAARRTSFAEARADRAAHDRAMA